MDIFSMDDLMMLAEIQNEICISIYMPAHPTDSEQNRIRFKNLYGEVEKTMLALDKRDMDRDVVMEPAKKFLEDQDFWQHQSDGLALFLSTEIFKTYRLPAKFEELSVVTEGFHIKPLLPFITGDTRFYVLAVSQGSVRLFQCTSQRIQELDMEGIPKSLSDSLKYDDLEKQLQFRTVTGGLGGYRSAVFHGHGIGGDDAKDRILRHFREIDKELHDLLNDKGRPLILAGVDYLHPIYREANSYSNLMEQGISGNPDEMKEKELHEKACTLIDSYAKKAQKDAAERCHDLFGTGKTSKDLEEIISSAFFGRVAVLFVAKGIQIWGGYDRENTRIEVHQTRMPGDADLLNLAAVQTLLKGGEVYVVAAKEIPGDSLALAQFRY